MDSHNWRDEVRNWLQQKWQVSPSLIQEAIIFFEKTFTNTRCYDRAWFGIHNEMISLVVGGIFLAALVHSGSDKGIWLLLDQNPPQINGFDYKPVKSTQRSASPLVWAHSVSFDTLNKIIISDEVWLSYTNASEKVLTSSSSSTDRDNVQLRRNKFRLTQIWPIRNDISHDAEQSQPNSGLNVLPVNRLTLHEIAAEINRKSKSYLIGKLQDIRTELKGLARRPGKSIFSPKTISDNWAFHHGGRSELQFNIGWEDTAGLKELRHGVAFSFETSKTLPMIDILVPKVRLFNDFLRLYPELYSDMRMWHYKENRSSDYMPGPISSELVTEGCFVFLGKRQPADNIDYDMILDDFDKLLPLYRYTENNNVSQPVTIPLDAPFTFKSGCTVKASSTVATYTQKQLNVNLRHNELQQALYQHLVSQYGKENVGTEITSGVGTSVDVIVRRDNGYWFYEIKTSLSPRACLREAIGQLLEYAFWPGAQPAIRLVVAGESPIDKDCMEYLRRLNLRFPLPIDYEQIAL